MRPITGLCAGVALAAVACWTAVWAQDKELEGRVAALEKLTPSAEDGALKSMVEAHDELCIAIRTSHLSDEDETGLQKRTDAAQDRYCVEGAKLAVADADQAFWLLRPLLTDRFSYDKISDAALSLLRSSNKGRNAKAEQRFRENNSYAANSGQGGNCVVSTEPFTRGSEAVNKGVSYYHTGDKLTWYIRCYAKQDLSDFAGEQGNFRVMLSANQYIFWYEPAGTPASHKAGERTADATFDFPRKPLDADDLAMLTAELRFFWVKEHVIEDGKLTPVWQSKQVATSTFFWEKKPREIK